MSRCLIKHDHILQCTTTLHRANNNRPETIPFTSDNRAVCRKKTWSPLPMCRSWFLSFPWAGKHLRNTSQYPLPQTIFWHPVLNRTSFLFTFIVSTQHVWINTRWRLIAPYETIPSTLSAILRYIYYFSGQFNRKRHYWQSSCTNIRVTLGWTQNTEGVCRVFFNAVSCHCRIGWKMKMSLKSFITGFPLKLVNHTDLLRFSLTGGQRRGEEELAPPRIVPLASLSP